MRVLLLFTALLTLALAIFCISAQAMQTGEMSTKIHQTCESLAADGIITNQDEAWRRLTTGWNPIIQPRWAIALTGYLFAAAVLFIAAWKWPAGITKEIA